MIRSDMGKNPILPQYPRKGDIKWLDSAPASFQKLGTSGQYIPSRRHAGRRTNKVIIEPHAVPCKALNIWRNPLSIPMIGL